MSAASLPGGADRDRRRALLAAIAALALVAWQVAGKATRDALFLSSFDVRHLPVAMVGSALVAVAFVLLFSRALARLGPARLLPASLLGSAALLVAEWVLAAIAPRAAAIALYFHFALLGAPLVSGFWSLVNESFDPHAARQAMGTIGTGAALGGVAGGTAALLAAGYASVPGMFGFLAALHLAGAFLALRLATDEPAPGEEAQGAAGLAALAGAPYLRSLALLVGTGAAVEAMLDYTLGAAATAGGAGGSRLMWFFALFHMGVGLLGVVAQAVLAGRALRRLGLAGTAATQPAAVVAGGLLGLLAPGVAAAVIARGAEAVLHNSLFRSAYELFYTPLREGEKRAAKALVDVGCDKLGAVLGAAAALLAVSVAPVHAPSLLFAGCVATAAASLVLCRRLDGGYVAALAASLRAGAVRLDMSEARDATTLHTLTRLDAAPGLRAALATPPPSSPADPIVEAVAALSSSDRQRARRMLQAQRRLDPRLVPFVVPLLGPSETSADALRALRTVTPRAVGQIVDALLDPAQPEAVRRRLPQALKGCAETRAVEGLLLGLADASFDVRRECAAALDRLGEQAPGVAVEREPLLAAAQRELDAWPAGLDPQGEEAERRLELVNHLLSCAFERRPVQIALWALRSRNRLSGTAREYLENVAPPALFRAMSSVLGLTDVGGSRRDAREVVAELVRAVEAGESPG
ncbi:MAG TPA: hypothetical protein VFM88_10630 [Vicinamibacteria bacterium]|nr:hypothetical protein [Vicinamibacteria bacterium]